VLLPGVGGVCATLALMLSAIAQVVIQIKLIRVPFMAFFVGQ
jgi:hypothetical protein